MARKPRDTVPTSKTALAPAAVLQRPSRYRDPTFWMTAGIAVALLGTAWAFDPGVDRGFDAPKRLLFFVGTLIAFLAASRQSPGAQAGSPSWRDRGPVLLLALAGACALVATAGSPWPVDWSEWRFNLALLLLAWMGGQAAWQEPGRAQRVWQIALMAVLVNVLISGLQHAGMPGPIDVARLGGRFDAGALLGNEGMVSLSGALAVPALLAMALSRNGVVRTALLMAALMCVGVMLLNRQLTSVLAASAGLLCVILLRWRKRAAVHTLVGLALLGLMTVTVPALRQPLLQRVGKDTIAAAQIKTTYRLGAVGAALEMIAERPWLGHGPGRYAKDSQRYRLHVSERWRTRLEMPPNANAFVYAHQDYLQWAAEFGLPSLLAGLAGLLWLVLRLLRQAWQQPDPERLSLSGVLITASVMALAWFPMHIPLLAALIALALGRAWRLTQGSGGKP